MFNSRIITVIKRELREKLFSKGFILMTLLIPVFIFGILALQTLFMTIGSDDHTKIQLITATEDLTTKVESELQDLEFIKSGHYIVEYKTIKKDAMPDYLKEKKSEIISEKLNGIIFIPETALKDKKIDYYSKSPNNNNVFEKMRTPINKALVDIYFREKQMSKDDIDYASKKVDFSGFKVSKEEKMEEAGYGSLILSFVLSFFLYFSLIFTGSIMMRSVVQEKSNKIVEILLSSVSAKDLMTGKILGTAITGVAQMAIWISPVIVLISTTWFMLPKELSISLSFAEVLYFLINYFIGLITFMALFASVGAIFDNDQDAQSGIWPIMMLIMIPFFITFSMTNNPANSLAKVASMLPFASIIVMPARMALIEIPAWQIILSFVINVVTMFLIFMMAGKIYRVGILMTGKKPKWSEVVQWVKYKY